MSEFIIYLFKPPSWAHKRWEKIVFRPVFSLALSLSAIILSLISLALNFGWI